VFKKERFMAEGTVKWFNPRKGYGFIADKEGRDIFVHYASISGEGYKTLNEGDPVSFDVVEGEKGLRAENVIPKAAASGKEKETEAASESKATSESSKATSESSKATSESSEATSESSEATSESSEATSESSETAEDEDKATS
jgi:CspA family cold shock protein